MDEVQECPHCGWEECPGAEEQDRTYCDDYEECWECGNEIDDCECCPDCGDAGCWGDCLCDDCGELLDDPDEEYCDDCKLERDES